MFDKARTIIQQVCLGYGLKEEDVVRRVKTKHITKARQECVRRLRAETELSLREIGHMLGYYSLPSHTK